MTDDFKIKIPIEIEGKSNNSTQSNYDKQLMKQQKESTSMLGGILKATAIVAAVWVALSPVLTPLLKLLSLLLLVVFLPLLPYIKEIAKKIGDTIKAIREGQKNETTPIESFTGGLGALFDTDIGALIGAGLLAYLLVANFSTLGAIIGGAIAVGILVKLTWNNFVEEGSFENALKVFLYSSAIGGIIASFAGFGGLSLFTIAFGVGAIMLLTYEFQNENFGVLDALSMFLSSAFLIFLGATWLGLGAPFAVAIGLAGLITISWSYISGLAKQSKAYDDVANGIPEIDYNAQTETMTRQFTNSVISPDLQNQIDSINFSNYKSELNDTEIQWGNLNSTAEKYMINMGTNVKGLSYKIGNTTNTNSLSTNLINSSNEFTNMANVSNLSVNNIITSLNRIPKKYVTIHEIRTIRTSRRGGFNL